MKYYWNDIIGHTRILNQLEKDVLNQNLAHAYLFAGPADVGKYTIAKKFANILICPNDYCRSCKDCQQFKQNLHPDVITVNKLWIEKENEDLHKIAQSSNFNQSHRTKTPKAKSDIISIDDLRSFSQKVFEKKQSKYKICLIKDIERMQDTCANAFLKVLEEPPVGTIFILTSSFPEKILSTLLSRVRKISFNNVADHVMLEKLQTHSNHTNLEEILSIAQGRPPIALKLLNDFELFEEEKTRFHQIASILSQNSLNQNFAFVDKITSENNLSEAFLDAFIRFIRTLLLEKAQAKNSGLAQSLSYQKLIQLFNLAQQAQNQIKQNINKKMLLENLMIEIQK